MLEYLDDLEADFLRFYSLDMYELDGPKFFRLAMRVAAYDGVMSQRVRAEREEAEEEGGARPRYQDQGKNVTKNKMPVGAFVNESGGTHSQASSNERSYVHDLLKKG